jgi:hypothetical protein
MPLASLLDVTSMVSFSPPTQLEIPNQQIRCHRIRNPNGRHVQVLLHKAKMLRKLQVLSCLHHSFLNPLHRPGFHFSLQKSE